jgi:hypothetical protein
MDEPGEIAMQTPNRTQADSEAKKQRTIQKGVDRADARRKKDRSDARAMQAGAALSEAAPPKTRRRVEDRPAAYV